MDDIDDQVEDMHDDEWLEVMVQIDEIELTEKRNLTEIENHMHDEKEIHLHQIDHIEDLMLIDDLPKNLVLALILLDLHIEINQNHILVRVLKGEMTQDHLDLAHPDLVINLDQAIDRRLSK